MNSFGAIPYVKSIQALDNIEEKWFVDFLNQHKFNYDTLDDLVYMLQRMNDEIEESKESDKLNESEYLYRISELESDLQDQKDKTNMAEVDTDDARDRVRELEDLLTENNIDY